jgi:hypothetical protein
MVRDRLICHCRFSPLSINFAAGDYDRAVETSNSAANITNVLYPNDSKSASPAYYD